MSNLSLLFEDLKQSLEEDIGYGPELSDLVRSLNALIKTNQGKFKSPKQAEFLYKKLVKHRNKNLEKSWGKKWIKNDPSAFALGYTEQLRQFGRRDISKIRYAGRVYVIDGGGVIAAAKADVRHPKKGSGDTFQLVGGKDIVFERRGKAPILYDAEKAFQEKMAKAKENEPLIKKIEAVPGYNDNDFLQDMVWNLSLGRKLTPGQLRVVNKFIPVEMETKEQADLEKLYQEGIDLLEKKVIKPRMREMESLLKSGGARDEKNIKYWIEQYKLEWQAWKKKPSKHAEISGDDGGVNMFLSDLGWNSGGPSFSGTFLVALGLVAKKGAKAPKWATKYVRYGIKLVEWLRRLTAEETVNLTREIWGA